MKDEEHIEQVNFINWFEYHYPTIKIFAIPNGGKRGIKTAVKLKAEGVKRGVPDLFIPEWNLWIEMKKVKGGSTSKEQKEWIDYLNDIGHTAIVCRGFEAAKQCVDDFILENLTGQSS